jgi:hypothetical protein
MVNERYRDAGYEGYPNAGYEGHRGYGPMTEVEMRREKACRYNWPYDGAGE